MTPDLSPELQRELLDDFFTECDDHLAQIRQFLVQLEASVGKAQADPAVVEALFRNFHSFKGISAIVGLREAEALAHATEDYLRELTRGKVTLHEETLELLMQATQRLEQIVVAFRSKHAIPQIDALLEQLRRASGKTSAPSQSQLPAPPGPISAEEASARGLVVWKFTFVPSRELDERGVNVNTVRSRLTSVGEILKATPQVRGQGSVAFEFMVAMKETPSDIASWESDGITAELQEQAAQDTPIAAPDGIAEHTPFIAPSHVVRVDLPRLDDLMRIVGEMVIQRSRFDDEISRLTRKGSNVDATPLHEINVGFARSLRELREGIMRVRLVPVAEIFARMPFVVRDLARETDKRARLVLEGQQTEIDKYLIEQLKDPLLHLVRNAFSHGVEAPEERRRAGKPEEATITLKAQTTGDSVTITIADDGRGVNKSGILQRAAALGMEVPDVVDNAALVKILCSPGFSTRDDADRASGRGIGMAVVQDTLRELGGAIALESEENRGTKFILRVPLTLAIAETLIVSAAEQTCAVPQSFVSEVMQVTEEDLQFVNGVEVMKYRAGILPVYRLSHFFRIRSEAPSRMCVLVLNSDRGSSGLVVDRIHGQKEVVVRPIRDPLIQAPGISGATELGDGRPVLILDGAAFTSGAVRPHFETASPESN
ncbi:MAG TPA: chemotaxis protein CheA [Verrucomicrobiae bacterium]|nr:chemotaxis protein CheA [Verrucomicrobiae bacterium]